MVCLLTNNAPSFFFQKRNERLASGPTPVSSGQPAYQQVAVEQVQGGADTNPMWASEVSNGDFQKALELSLRAFNYYVVDGAMAKYKVTASIVDVQKPLMGSTCQ